MLEETGTFYCAFCGEENVIPVDISAGLDQDYIEDCQVCCRPNHLRIHFDEETLIPHIEADSDD